MAKNVCVYAGPVVTSQYLFLVHVQAVLARKEVTVYYLQYVKSQAFLGGEILVDWVQAAS